MTPEDISSRSWRWSPPWIRPNCLAQAEIWDINTWESTLWTLFNVSQTIYDTFLQCNRVHYLCQSALAAHDPVVGSNDCSLMDHFGRYYLLHTRKISQQFLWPGCLAITNWTLSELLKTLHLLIFLASNTSTSRTEFTCCLIYPTPRDNQYYSLHLSVALVNSSYNELSTQQPLVYSLSWQWWPLQ